MRYYYDTEFIETGYSLDLISIGIVADDGREYYAVSNAITRGRLNTRLRKHQWLMQNVVPGLPRPKGERILAMSDRWLFDYAHPSVKPYDTIANEVKAFLLDAESEPELWAYYAAFDHVALAWLWGPMSDMPEGLPYWTNDLRQEHVRLGSPELPKQEAGLHNALEDARWNKRVADFLRHLDGQERTGYIAHGGAYINDGSDHEYSPNDSDGPPPQ